MQRTAMPAVSGFQAKMLRGTVSGDQRALITVDIIGEQGLLEPIDAVLDTGFNGYLTLTTESILRLGLPFVGHRVFELANGESVTFEGYLATVWWHEVLRDALVLKSDAEPLLGMTLLWGSRITIDASPNGEVTIEELTPPF